MSSRQNKSIFLLLAISAILMCIFVSGCTSDAKNTASAGTDNIAPSGEKPTGDAGQIPPEMNGTEGAPGGGMKTMDYASAAAALGVNEDELKAAIGTQSEGTMPDFESAAAALGVTVEELQNALGMTGGPGGDRPEGEMPQEDGGQPPEGTPPEM